MTLQEIFNILQANIQSNGGALKLAKDTIVSAEITDIFDKYLLNQELIIKNAIPELHEENVTVNGEGDSLIFFKTLVKSLVFTVDGDVPSLSVEAEAVIKASEGWTFGASFPVLARTNWGGYKDPDPNTNKWIQYIFFESGKFTLSKDGLYFRGLLKLEKGLEPLSVLFKGMDKVEMKGAITLNKGQDGYVVTKDTVMPEMFLAADIGKVDLPLGDNFVFTLSFGMKATAWIVPKGKEKGRPAAVLEMLIQSTLPVNNEQLGVAIAVGTQAGSLTIRAVIPEHTEIGMSELISLANNGNVLAVLPSNIPIIDFFTLKSWQLVFNTKQKSITMMALEVATRSSFSWTLIPGFFTIESLKLWLAFSYFNKAVEPALTLEGTVGIGSGTDKILIDLSASFPGYVFMGSLNPDTPIDLRKILIYFLGESIGDSLPDTLKIGVLDISIDANNSTYSLATALTTDIHIPAVLTTIVVRTVLFNIDYVAGAATGSIGGTFQLGEAADSPEVSVTAAYAGAADGWTFSGSLAEGDRIELKPMIDRFLPAEYHAFNPLDIDITTLAVSFTQGTVRKYNFSLGAEWTLDLGLQDPFIIKGLTTIAFDGAKPVGQQYTGFIQGSLDFGNLHVGARVDFKDKNNDYTFFFNGFQAKLTQQNGDSIICFTFTDNTTLGDLIAMLVSAATGEDITLPSPWNVMNNIKLKDFGFSFNITQKKIGLSYRPNLNLGFINIKEITLYYTYSSDGTTKPKVEIAITDGSFLGGAQPLPKPWDVLDPSKAPPVPGKGENVFRLDFLGMGQHVSLKDGKAPKSVAEAVAALKAAFEKKGLLPPAVGASPITGTGLKFNNASNWLIGTEFIILETFSLGVVFFDPDLYGLSLSVSGPKAKVFEGLKFEILYKKVTDTVGVYQIYLKLPDAIRQIDFGAVSVTLPSIRLYIYTNGDFKVDLGFPLNDNFAESFGVQFLPFTGAGGFYIGALSAGTAETVPVTTKGNFSPVIVFGIGLRVGIGKEINKGILKAGLSIVVQGIVEGTFAQYNAFKDGGGKDEIYYYVLGKLAIVGHLYGSIDFAIISAELDLKVFVSARVVLEVHEPVLLTLSAGVSVSLRVKINLGIFSISINLSFSTTIQESFTVGRRTPKPWDGASLSIPFRLPVLRALDAEECGILPEMNWQPIIPEKKEDLSMFYLPQFTVAADANGIQQSRAIAMLYLETSIDQPPGKKYNGSDLDPFSQFAKGAFLWVLGAWINKTEEGIPVQTILDTEVTAQDLSSILCYFSTGVTEPFSAEDILDFMEGYLDITITIPPRTTNGDTQASIFPMLPILEFNTPAGTIYFDDEKAKYTYDEKQLSLIRALFRELAVRNLDNASRQRTAPRSVTEPGDKKSLATYMLVDYLALLAKEAVQRGIDRLNLLTVPVQQEHSLYDIANNNPHYGISPEELAFANRTRPLATGVDLQVKGVRYTVKHGDTLSGLAWRFNVDAATLKAANTFTSAVAVNPCAPPPPAWTAVQQVWGMDEQQALVPGTALLLPVFTHTTSSNREETLLSIAHHYGVPVQSLLNDNLHIPGLFSPGSRIRVPFAEKMKVADLIKAMEEQHDFEHMAGLSSNIMLQGLRVPLPEADSQIGKPEAMYVVTGQEIEASTLQVDNELILQLPAALSWLNLGTKGGTSLPFKLIQEDITALTDMAGTQLTPHLQELKALDLYEIQARKYTLPVKIDWQVPQTIVLSNGNSAAASIADPSIWMFKNNLQALISGSKPVTPKVKLLRQVQETLTITGDANPIANYSWSTAVNIMLRQVKQTADPTQFMPCVYEVQGIDQLSMQLLQDLLEFGAHNPQLNMISAINILYSKEPAQEGQTAPPTGLRSDGVDHTTVFLLQTNLSTLSNPTLAADAPAPQVVLPNLLGMTPIGFLRFLWEAAIVGTGGYYLYYQIKESKTGLPDYLFNGDTDAQITLMITYNVTDNVLKGFMNSVVINDPVDVTSEILYIETIEEATNNEIPAIVAPPAASRINVKVATVPPGNIGFTMKRTNPANRNDVTPVEVNLEELYNLLEYNIAANNDFDKTSPGLPVAPADKTYKPPIDPDIRVRPTGISTDDWLYDRIVPVFPFVKTNGPTPALPAMIQQLLANSGSVNRYRTINENDIPPAKDNPYRAVGKSVQIDMRWVDLFGNLTNFTNTGNPVVLPPVKTGYIDPVIGLDQFPSITGSYAIEKDVNDAPTLKITLAFNPTKYQPVDINDQGWKERARADREAYRLIYYQLIQEDMKLTVTNTLEVASVVQATDDPKALLLTLVLEVYQYLGELVPPTPPFRIVSPTPPSFPAVSPEEPVPPQREDAAVAEPVPPSDKYILQPISDTNPASLFELVTSLRLARDSNLVDDHFKDEPSVIEATTVIGPDLDNVTLKIQDFVRDLEATFPQLKVASGLTQTGVEEDRAIELWVMRFDTGPSGIQFEITNKDKPFYFAVQPLSTHLLSREEVLIYPYTTGTPVFENTAIPMSFNGVDLEKLAAGFLQAIDNFLLADFSIPAWLIEQGAAPGGPDLYIPDPYQRIVAAKKLLAENISKHLTTVLKDGSTPDANNLQQATERLKQQLLITLSDAYTIDTVLQFEVKVTSPYTDPLKEAPNLFGKVLDPADTSTPEQKAYAFSTTRFSLEKSTAGNGEEQRSYLNILFNTKKENLKTLDSSYFPIDLHYEINSIEHGIHPVAGIDGYKASSWLTFVLPFGNEHTKLGNLKIPIPLRAYPTAPSLTTQTFIPIVPQFTTGLRAADEDNLQKAKTWNYQYSYDYLRAQQDTINTDILLNVDRASLLPAAFKDDEDPDLFAALLQFTQVYPALQRDLNQYLIGMADPTNAFTAMESLAWLAGRVAKAWGSWKEDKKLYANVTLGEHQYKYEIAEDEWDQQPALRITVTPRDGTVYKLPVISLEGYTTEIITDQPGKRQFVYYTEINNQRVYLSPGDGYKITRRIITFDGFNIMKEEDAWSGLSIVRNKILVPGIPTNDDFIYETPVIRFVNILTPLLDPAIEIDMAVYTPPPVSQKPLQVYLSNFLQAFFNEIPVPATRLIKIGVQYTYDIQENQPGLQAALPICITTPYTFEIPKDWETTDCPPDPLEITPESALVCQLTALIREWFGNNEPVKNNGRLLFDLSLFSSLSDSKLPVLRIRNIYLNINIVDIA